MIMMMTTVMREIVIIITIAVMVFRRCRTSKQFCRGISRRMFCVSFWHYNASGWMDVSRQSPE